MNDHEVFFETIQEELRSGALILPTLPEVALNVREVVDDPNASAAGLADIIITDAALSARLLKVANSALYRGRVPVESVQVAVSRLGLSMVRNLVTSLVMEQLYQTRSERVADRLQALWEHSTQVAVISQMLAAEQASIKTDEAMLAGLIHDIGVLPILVKAGEQPELFNDDAALDQLIARLHPRIGEAILTEWEFPPAMIAVAAGHEDLKRNNGGAPDLVDIVQVANLQSYYSTERAMDPLLRDEVGAFARLGIDTGFSVVELDENSAEYAEALALFAMAA